MDSLAPRIMGHRGAAAVAPENTLAGLRKAAELGAHWVEFDVSLTRDGIPVLFHDYSLKRTTGQAGLLREFTFANLRRLEAGSWFSPAFSGEPIPSLEEALDVVLKEGLTPNVELKSTPGSDLDIAAAAVEALRRCWPKDRPKPLISSFSRLSLTGALRLAPDIPRALIAHRMPTDWAESLAELECVALHLNGKYLRAERVSRIKRAGYRCGVFTVNRASRARELVGWGADTVITDDLAIVISALTEAAPEPSSAPVTVHAVG
jgi:glycerophosphoryl diester phosphodiesterase